MKRAIVIGVFIALCAVRAQALVYTNIFGAGADDFLNGPASSALVDLLPSHFTRIQANWFDIEPAPNQYNFTNPAASCNDAIISNETRLGRTILYDVCGYPAWVQNTDWANRYADMRAYVTNVLNRWPQIKILGCWNEPSLVFTNADGSTNSSCLILNPPSSDTYTQLMAEYNLVVTNIWLAKQSVNPTIQLNVGKVQEFDLYFQALQLLTNNGTWLMADYITWHDYYGTNVAIFGSLDLPAVTNIFAFGRTIHSAPQKIAMAQALFPGKLVGSDEWYTYDLTQSVLAATAYRVNGAAMLDDAYMSQPVPLGAGTISAIYGANSNFTLNTTSLAILQALASPVTNVATLRLQNWHLPFSQITTSTTPPVVIVTNTVFNEWYGPFASWTNVTAWGAVCDGVTDDSTAVSNALAAVGTGTCSPVLLIPGMCRVTQKPWLSQRINVSIVGTNRDTCGFIYDGGTVSASDANNSGASSCFHIDGVANSYFARLTFNGNGKARTVLASSQQSSSGIFNNNNLFEDVVIKNAAPGGIGIDGGHFGWGFSNDEFLRCLIETNGYGAELENFNALDAWFTDCMFDSNNVAINVNFGDAHAYHTFFQHNGIDFSHNPGAAFCSLVSNVSYQSGGFLVTSNQNSAGTQLLIKGNTVIDPSDVAYRMGQYGPVVMLDNSTLTTNATIHFYNGSGFGDLVAVGNTNGISNWLSITGGVSMRTNLVDNYVVNRASLTFVLPSVPMPATNLHRTVFEMATNVSSSTLQASLTSAADGCVFHIPANMADDVNHIIQFNSTITVPSNKDVRIVGDGQFTKLVWEGSSGGTMFACPYPSHATFSHVELQGNNGSAGNCLAITGVGTTMARVYLRASNMQRGVSNNVFLGDCPNTVVDFSGLSYGATATPPFSGGANIILGGRGKARFIQSDGGNNTVGYICTNGGQLYVETSYNEAADTHGHTIFLVGGGGTISFVDTKLVENIGSDDYSRATSNGFAVANLTGQLAFMNCGNMIDWFNITGDTTGLIWINGNTTFNSPAGTFPILNVTGDTPVQTMNYNYNGSGSRYTDVLSASASFTRQMLSQARAEYTDRAPMTRRTNQTDVLLEQVFFELGNQNLSVTP